MSSSTQGRTVWAGVLLAIIICFLATVDWGVHGKATEPAKRSVCAGNLGATGKGIAVYANQYYGQFPDEVDILVTQGLAHPGQFECPSDPWAEDDYTFAGNYSSGQPMSPRLHEILHSRYMYIPGQNIRSDSQNVLMYEKKECHKGAGSNVLFVNGSTGWIEPYSKVEELVAQTKQRLTATTMPAGETAR